MTTKKSMSKAAKPKCEPSSQKQATNAPWRQGCVDQASHRWTLDSKTENAPDIHHQRALDAYIVATFRWRIAIEKAESGDVSGIIELLNSGQIAPPECQSLLADLLNRRQLTKKRGRQRRPIYESTPEERKLEKAAYWVRERQREGMRFEDALDEVARNRTIEANKLGNFIKGKGSRRSRRRKSIPAAKHEDCGR